MPFRDLIPIDVRVRYVRLDEKLTIGSKRNRACQLARGEFIAHWDDDDQYRPSRLRTQVNALLEHGAQVCGSSTLYYVEAETQRAWQYAYTASSRKWVAGNTLMYRKSFWRQHPLRKFKLAKIRGSCARRARMRFATLPNRPCASRHVHAGNTSHKNAHAARIGVPFRLTGFKRCATRSHRPRKLWRKPVCR